MTDLLGRLAARAVGRADLARPRLPGRFEGIPGRSSTDLEVVDDEVAASSRADAGAPDAATAATTAPIPVSSEAAPVDRAGQRTASRSQGGEVPDGPMPVAPMTAARPRTVASAEVGRPSPSMATTSGLDASDHQPAGAAEADPITTHHLMVVPVAAMPATRSAADDAVPTQRVGNPDALEAPVVRIHIGRLEVRATMPDARPDPKPRVVEPTTRTPSLSEFLRGGR